MPAPALRSTTSFPPARPYRPFLRHSSLPHYLRLTRAYRAGLNILKPIQKVSEGWQRRHQMVELGIPLVVIRLRLPGAQAGRIGLPIALYQLRNLMQSV